MQNSLSYIILRLNYFTDSTSCLLIVLFLRRSITYIQTISAKSTPTELPTDNRLPTKKEKSSKDLSEICDNIC